MRKYLIILLITISLCPICHASDRRILGWQHKDGNYETLLNKGECRENYGCVLDERYTTGGWLHQDFDVNDDGECDYVVIWRPIVDPTYGKFYTPYQTAKCGGNI